MQGSILSVAVDAPLLRFAAAQRAQPASRVLLAGPALPQPAITVWMRGVRISGISGLSDWAAAYNRKPDLCMRGEPLPAVPHHSMCIQCANGRSKDGCPAGSLAPCGGQGEPGGAAAAAPTGRRRGYPSGGSVPLSGQGAVSIAAFLNPVGGAGPTLGSSGNGGPTLLLCLKAGWDVGAPKARLPEERVIAAPPHSMCTALVHCPAGSCMQCIAGLLLAFTAWCYSAAASCMGQWLHRYK